MSGISIASGVSAVDTINTQFASGINSLGALVTDWGSAGVLSTTGSTGTGFSFALDSTTVYNNKPAIKATLQSDATAQTFIGIWTPTNPIILRDMQAIQIPLKFTSTNASNIDYTSVRVWLQLSDGKSIRISFSGVISGYQANVFNTYSFSRNAAAANTQDPVSSLDTPGVTVTSVRFVVTTTGNANAFPFWLGEIRADLKSTVGRVCIIMDGEYTSQHSLIYPVCQSLGLVGSLAITNTDIGTGGRMSITQINDMYNSGWDCIHHTFNSLKTGGYGNAVDWPLASDIATDIRSQWSYFKTQGWTRGIGFGVWGYTYAFISTLTQTRQNLVRDGIVAGGMWAMRKSVPFASENGQVLVPLSRAAVDPLVIHGGIQVTSTDTAAGIIQVIDAAIARGELAIITLHRAVLDEATPGALEIRIGELTTALTYLANKVNQGVVVVEPFSKTCSSLFSSPLSFI